MARLNYSFNYNFVFVLISLLGVIGLVIHSAGSTVLVRAEENGPALKCQGEKKDPWLSAWRTNAEKDKLYLYAVKLFNNPVGCEGKITDTFEHTKFGIMRFTFAGGNELEIETFPPEASRITFRVPQGFPDEEEARAVLQQYLREMGLRIDWSQPREEAGGGEVKTLYYPDEALDAAAVMVYKNTKLIEIGFYMAL